MSQYISNIISICLVICHLLFFQIWWWIYYDFRKLFDSKSHDIALRLVRWATISDHNALRRSQTISCCIFSYICFFQLIWKICSDILSSLWIKKSLLITNIFPENIPVDPQIKIIRNSPAIFLENNFNLIPWDNNNKRKKHLLF